MWRSVGAFALATLAGLALAEGPQPPRSGSTFQGESVRQMQADEFANPGMLWVSRGERLWREARGPADVIGIRVENVENSSMNRALITLGVSALVVSLLASLIFFGINACANMFNGRFGRLSQSLRLFVSQPSPAIVASRSTVSG